jgi:cobalt-zinc-cadmium efflux system protein
MQVLLEGVPQGVELQQVYDGLKRLPGVEDVHDLHIWEITNGQISLTVHLIVSDSDSSQKTLESARQIVSSFGIEHTSVQMEYRGMGISERRNHMFAPPTDRKTSG